MRVYVDTNVFGNTCKRYPAHYKGIGLTLFRRFRAGRDQLVISSVVTDEVMYERTPESVQQLFLAFLHRAPQAAAISRCCNTWA
jgi:hypothetical protein